MSDQVSDARHESNKYKVALEKIRELMGPENRERFVMQGPAAFAAIYYEVEAALQCDGTCAGNEFGDCNHGEVNDGLRRRRMAKVCGDKVFVLCIRPAGEPGWLYLERPEDIVDYVLDGEPGDEWEMKWTLMSREEIDALPEHTGW